MAKQHFRKSDGSITVMRNGRIVGNISGAGFQVPQAEDQGGIRSWDEALETEVPVSVEGLFDAYQEHRVDQDFVAPTEFTAAAGDADVSIPRELQEAAKYVTDSVGADDRQGRALLSSQVSALGLHRDTRLVPGSEAAAAVTALLDGTPNPDAVAFIERLKSEHIMLTVSELEVLRSMRDVALREQEMAHLSQLESPTWITPVEQRRCNVCGRFVGALGSHQCDVTKASQLADELCTRHGRKRITLQKISHEPDGTTREVEHKVSALKNGDDIPTEHLQDIYLGLVEPRFFGHDYEWSNLLRRSTLMMAFYKKPLFGEGQLLLPDKLRDAYLQDPNMGLSPFYVAETISPPFDRYEIQRLLEKCNERDTLELLNSPRAREDVAYLLANTPTKVGASLAEQGQLPIEVLREMSTCGDQAVRRQAALDRSMPEDITSVLATDPDVDVRAAVVFGGAGVKNTEKRAYDSVANVENIIEQVQSRRAFSPAVRRHAPFGAAFRSALAEHPALISTFVNDPNDGIALGALACFPYSRQALQAVGQVTSRRRLKIIAAHLDTIWPYHHNRDFSHSTKFGFDEKSATETVEHLRAFIAKRL